MNPTVPLSNLDAGKEKLLPFQRIFEAQPGKILILSPDFYIIAATNAYLQELGIQRENMIGKYLFDVFPDNPDLADSPSQSLKSSLNLVLATGGPHKMDVLRYDIPDNNNNPGNFLERYWNSINTPVFNNSGIIDFIIHETINVTDTVKKEIDLKESQERERNALAQANLQRIRLERLFEQAPASLAILEGPDLVYKVINKGYQQLFPGRVLLNKPLFEALPELKDQPIEGIMRKVYQTGETFEGKEVLVPLARHEGAPIEDIYWNFIYQAIFDGDAFRHISDVAEIMLPGIRSANQAGANRFAAGRYKNTVTDEDFSLPRTAVVGA